MAMSNTGTFTFPMPVTIDNGDSITIDHTSTTSGVFVVAGTSATTTTAKSEWMARPMTADEIIDQAARELARKRPAD